MTPLAPKFLLLSAAALALSACQPGDLNLGGSKSQPDAASAQNVAMIERDVESPEVFQASDQALWDGRPSLGGVWVAAPGVKDPERVIMRNPANGKSVIGALFKRERANPGPALQLSSDAAAELGILAGQPTEISVTALRRTEVPDPDATPIQEASEASGQAAPPAEISASALDDPLATSAAAAIDRATPVAPVAATPAPAPASSSLPKAFVQIGIFSIEKNARNTASALSNAGLSPTVLAQQSNGKKFWRVVVGPAATAADRAKTLRTAKSLGFSDAYAVTN